MQSLHTKTDNVENILLKYESNSYFTLAVKIPQTHKMEYSKKSKYLLSIFHLVFKKTKYRSQNIFYIASFFPFDYQSS